jgi:hypothetical protein
MTEHRKALERERIAREREQIHLQHIEEQEAASPQNQASKHSIRELATPITERQKVGKERDMQQVHVCVCVCVCACSCVCVCVCVCNARSSREHMPKGRPRRGRQRERRSR